MSGRRVCHENVTFTHDTDTSEKKEIKKIGDTVDATCNVPRPHGHRKDWLGNPTDWPAPDGLDFYPDGITWQCERGDNPRDRRGDALSEQEPGLCSV